jgi:hypothetical protein
VTQYGYCSKCNNYGIINFHHNKYLELDGIDEEVVLCPGCHLKYHLKMKKENPNRALLEHKVTTKAFERKRRKTRKYLFFAITIEKHWSVSEIIAYNTVTDNLNVFTQFIHSIGNNRNITYGLNK